MNSFSTQIDAFEYIYVFRNSIGDPPVAHFARDFRHYWGSSYEQFDSLRRQLRQNRHMLMMGIQGIRWRLGFWARRLGDLIVLVAFHSRRSLLELYQPHTICVILFLPISTISRKPQNMRLNQTINADWRVIWIDWLRFCFYY